VLQNAIRKNKFYKNTIHNQYKCFNALDMPIAWTIQTKFLAQT